MTCCSITSQCRSLLTPGASLRPDPNKGGATRMARGSIKTKQAVGRANLCQTFTGFSSGRNSSLAELAIAAGPRTARLVKATARDEAAAAAAPTAATAADKQPQDKTAAAQKALNVQLCAATTAQGVLEVLASVGSMEELGDVNAITAFHRLAKHAMRGGGAGGGGQVGQSALQSQLLPKLLAHLERPSMQWSAMGVANVLWAHAVLGHGSKALVDKVYRQLDWMGVEESARCCTLLLYAMARLRRPHPLYLRRLSTALAAEAEFGRRIGSAGPDASLPVASVRPAGAGQALQVGGSAAVGSGIEDLRGTSGSSGSSGGSSTRHSSSGGGSSTRHSSSSSSHVEDGKDGSSSSSSSSSNAIAGSEGRHAIAGTGLLAGLTSQQLCLLSYSLASLGSLDARGLSACLDELAARDLSGLSAKSLCQVTRGLAAASIYHEAACDAIAAAAARLPEPQLDAETCSRLIHDYATIYQRHLVQLGHDPNRRLHWQAAVREFVRQGPARRAMLLRLVQRAEQGVGRMGSVSLSSLVWGLATLGQRQGTLLDAVADRAMQLGTRLDAQAVASICWAFAALGHDHPRMMEALAGTALALLSDPARRHEFNSQTVPMLALSYAVANRCDLPSGRSMMAALAGRAEEVLADLTPQGLSNLGWALAVAQLFPPTLLPSWRAAVAEALPLCGPLELNQLHQVQAMLRLEAEGAALLGAPHQPELAGGAGGEGSLALSSFDSLFEALYQRGRLRSVTQRGWEREKQWGHRTVTRFQTEIHAMLCVLGLSCELEHEGAGGEYTVDIAIHSERIAVECDGPSHFMANSQHVGGATALKHRLLAQLGWRVVAIPYFEWPRDPQQQAEYLARRLEEAGLRVDPTQAAMSASLATQYEPKQRRQRRSAQAAAAKLGAAKLAASLPPSVADIRQAGEGSVGGGVSKRNAARAGPAFLQPLKGAGPGLGWSQGSGGSQTARQGSGNAGRDGSTPGGGGSSSASSSSTVQAGSAEEGPASVGRDSISGAQQPPPSSPGAEQQAPPDAGEEGKADVTPGGGGGTVGERAQRLAVMQFKSGKLSRTGLLARKSRIDAGAKQGISGPAGGGGGPSSQS